MSRFTCCIILAGSIPDNNERCLKAFIITDRDSIRSALKTSHPVAYLLKVSVTNTGVGVPNTTHRRQVLATSDDASRDAVNVDPLTIKGRVCPMKNDDLHHTVPHLTNKPQNTLVISLIYFFHLYSMLSNDGETKK